MPTHLVIISSNKEELINSVPLIEKKLKETHQKMNNKKTRIDTAYHGVPFLGKVSYPYGYQKPSKQVVKRVSQKAKKFNCTEENNLLAKVNSQIGNLKNYNCKKLIQNYESLLPQETKEKVKLDKTEYKFKKLEKNEEVYCTYVLNK